MTRPRPERRLRPARWMARLAGSGSDPRRPRRPGRLAPRARRPRPRNRACRRRHGRGLGLRHRSRRSGRRFALGLDLQPGDRDRLGRHRIVSLRREQERRDPGGVQQRGEREPDRRPGADRARQRLGRTLSDRAARQRRRIRAGLLPDRTTTSAGRGRPILRLSIARLASLFFEPFMRMPWPLICTLSRAAAGGGSRTSRRP